MKLSHLSFLLFSCIFTIVSISGFLTWYLHTNLQISEKLDEDGYAQSSQFFGDMRYANTTIYYWIDENCSKELLTGILQGLMQLDVEINISFEPSKENPNVIIQCVYMNKSFLRYIQGNAVGVTSLEKVQVHKGWVELIVTSIKIYDDPLCTAQTTEHEMIHALGFEHSQNPKSLMYPIQEGECDEQTLNPYFVEKINWLYSLNVTT